MSAKRLFIVLMIIVLALPLLPAVSAQGDVTYPTTEWRTSTPEEQGMDSAQLLAALDYIESQNYAIDSITVIRNGNIVLDAYYAPYTADMKHHLSEATTSVMATLAGIALDQGLIESLDQPMLELFPDITAANMDAEKEATTVRHLLEGSARLYCRGWEFEALVLQPDALQAILDLPAVAGEPGSTMNLCFINAHLLGGAIERAAGMPLLDYAGQNLFGPLGISDYWWQTNPDGMPIGSVGLYLTPHDMARLGYLYLHGGEWAGEQVVSSDWVDAASCADPAACPFYYENARQGYGYGLYIFHPHFYGAWGWDGQFIAVAPEYDMVVVLTSSGDTQDGISIPYELIDQQIIGAARSDEPLPANPDAVAALEARVQALANPQPQAAAPLPEKTAQFDGVSFILDTPIQFTRVPFQAYVFGGWPGDINAFTLRFDQPDEAMLELEFSDGYTMVLPVGLDGVHRVADTRFGPLASVGQWSQNGQAFSMEIELVGGADRMELTFGSLGNNVVVFWGEPAFETDYGLAGQSSTAHPRE